MGELKNIIIYMAAAVTLVPIFKRIGLGSVVGYLVAGLAIGPYGFKLVESVEETRHFAEFGVVMLLFLIGLELNLRRLWQLRRSIVGAGGIQVVGCIALLTGAAFFATSDLKLALVLAMGFSLSSTAIGLQLLRERNLQSTEAGKTSFAVLLFQDLAVIPMLSVLPLLAGTAAVAVENQSSGFTQFIKAVSAVVLLVAVGRYLLRPLFRFIAASRVREVFTAASLLLVLSISALMQWVGLSMALGSFLAGVLLAESEYRHELEIDIEPFKGLLLGLFFISVGMSIDLRLVLNNPLLLLGLVFGVLLIKCLVLFFTGKYFGLTFEGASVFSIALSQGGEFAFVLFGLAASLGLIQSEAAGMLNLGIAVTMLMTPILFLLGDRLLSPVIKKRKKKATPETVELEKHPVILAGYGRFGQQVGRILNSLGVETTVLDHDPNQIELMRQFGWKTFYGDVSRLDLLHAAGADKAKLLVLAINDPDVSVATVDLVQKHFPHLKVFARARSRTDAYEFLQRKVPMVRETFLSALDLTEKVLCELGVSAFEAREIAHRFKEYDESMMLRSLAHLNDTKTLVNISHQARQELVKLMEADSQRAESETHEGWG